MLVTLNVKNFAIIDNIQVDFNKGLTVLTGETGAGKSLIIDAISLLFGERASNDLIRHGEPKATIEGIFSDYDSKITNILDELSIDYDENDFLFIKRELYQNGKSLCKINNQNVSLNQLKQISEYIGDIHSQLETFGLINPKNYISFLRDDKIDLLINDYQNELKEYKNALSKLENLENNIKENSMKEDYLKYQLNELDKANLNIDEEISLSEELKILSNSEKVKSLIQSLKETYNDSDVLDNNVSSNDMVNNNMNFSFNSDLSNLQLNNSVSEQINNELNNQINNNVQPINSTITNNNIPQNTMLNNNNNNMNQLNNSKNDENNNSNLNMVSNQSVYTQNINNETVQNNNNNNRNM